MKWEIKNSYTSIRLFCAQLEVTLKWHVFLVWLYAATWSIIKLFFCTSLKRTVGFRTEDLQQRDKRVFVVCTYGVILESQSIIVNAQSAKCKHSKHNQTWVLFSGSEIITPSKKLVEKSFADSRLSGEISNNLKQHKKQCKHTFAINIINSLGYFMRCINISASFKSVWLMQNKWKV